MFIYYLVWVRLVKTFIKYFGKPYGNTPRERLVSWEGQLGIHVTATASEASFRFGDDKYAVDFERLNYSR